MIIMTTMKQQTSFPPLEMQKLNKKTTNNHTFISSKEALADIIPIDWNAKDDYDGVNNVENTKAEKR